MSSSWEWANALLPTTVNGENFGGKDENIRYIQDRKNGKTEAFDTYLDPHELKDLYPTMTQEQIDQYEQYISDYES